MMGGITAARRLEPRTAEKKTLERIKNYFRWMKPPGVGLCCPLAVGGVYGTTGQPTLQAWPLMPKGLRDGNSTPALEDEFPLQMAVTVTLSEFLNTCNKKESLL